MRSLIVLIAALIALPAVAEEGFGYDLPQTTQVEKVEPPPIKPKASDQQLSQQAQLPPDVYNSDVARREAREQQVDRIAEMATAVARVSDFERRLAAVEAKAISADEARQIAEEVVDRRINELRLAISTPNGGQRIETVKFQTYGDTAGIKLNPGERILSYTDANGNLVKVNQPSANCNCPDCNCVNCQCGNQASRAAQPVRYQQPVQQWQTADVQFSMPAQPVNTMRTVQMQPVRRGLFGRTVYAPVVQSTQQQVPQAMATSCRMMNINGRMVKVCN